MSKEEMLQQIAKMIASGEIPKEIYDKYLGKCPIGFMSEETLFNFLKQDNREQKLIKYLEDKINQINSLINPKSNKIEPYGEELRLYENSLNNYQEILERVKSSKYE